MRQLQAALLFAAAAVLLCLTPGPAGAQYFGQNKVQYRQYEWRSIGAEHFDVYYYPGLDSLALRVLDLAEKTHVMLSQRMGHSLGRKVPIILYGSHNDFAQTNITPEIIDGGTGGFTEALRNRVVLPFTGSYEDLRHVVVHELVHAFMFDLVYQGNAASLLARQAFFAVPLWFAEGMAEYYSLGMEPNAEMFLRDGTMEGYLPPLMYSGGYFVYKQGQSAISYLVDRYGEDRLRDVLQRVRQVRDFDRAFQLSVGMSVAKFDEQWREWLRQRYWPTVVHKMDPERFAKRLTNHRRDGSRLNTQPAVSPQGDRIAYFTDRRQYTDVYIMSSFDGRRLRRVIRGDRTMQFESVPSFRTAIAWSPEGDRLALVAKSEGRDVLYVVSARDGKVIRRYRLPVESLSYPAWAPGSDSVAVTGVKDGRSDLWLVHARTGAVSRLTQDAYDEKEPVWSPDGRSITFASDRLAPVVLHPERQQMGWGAYALYTLDLRTRETRFVLDTHGDDRSPAWSPDGRHLAFISDRDGTPNVYLYTAADSSVIQLTDVIGGITSLSWSQQDDRVVFSAFSRGGFDIFAVREPLSSEGVLRRLRGEVPWAVLDPAEARRAGAPPRFEVAPRGALANRWGASRGAADSLRTGPRTPREALAAADSAAGGVAPATLAAAAPDTGGYSGLSPAELLGDRRRADSLLAAGALSDGEAALLFYADSVGVDSALAGLEAERAEPPRLTPAELLGDRARADSLLAAGALSDGEAALLFYADSIGVDSALAGLAAERPEAARLTPAELLGDRARADSLLAAGALSDGEAALLFFADSVGVDSALAAVADTSERMLPGAAMRQALLDAQRESERLANAPAVPGPTATAASAPAGPVLASYAGLAERGGPFALPDSVLSQRPTPYRGRLSPDYAGGGLVGASGIGVAGTAQFQFSDFLGNHNLGFSVGLFSNTLQDLNAIVAYRYLPRRWDFSISAFHVKYYFSSFSSPLGQDFGYRRDFSERNAGVQVGMQYPFDRFRRVEFHWFQDFVEREFYETDVFGDLYQADTEFLSISAPSVSLVGDYALWGYYGPMSGQRYELSLSAGLPLFENAMSYRTLRFDGRRYLDFGGGYTLATRFVGHVSDGEDPQTSRLGGYFAVRGYPDWDIYGTRTALYNVELRFPFIQQLGVVGPVPLGLFNLRGAAFFDAAMAWNEGDPLRFSHQVDGEWALDSPYASFGFGVRTSLYYMILNVDCGWPTDLNSVGGPRWYFSIGPEF